MEPLLEVLRRRGPRSPTPGVSTGLLPLDDLTGGMRSGRLWLLTSRPGNGRTTLLMHLAAAHARAAALPSVVCSTEHSTGTISTRLAASILRRPTSGHGDDPEASVSTELLDRMTRTAPGAERVLVSGSDLRVPVGQLDELTRRSPHAVFIDGADRSDDLPPARLRAWADAASFVCVAVSRSTVLRPAGGDVVDLDETWTRRADLFLDIRSSWVEPGREGTAAIDVVYHPRGPRTCFEVGFAPAYSLVHDLGV